MQQKLPVSLLVELAARVVTTTANLRTAAGKKVFESAASFLERVFTQATQQLYGDGEAQEDEEDEAGDSTGAPGEAPTGTVGDGTGATTIDVESFMRL